MALTLFAISGTLPTPAKGTLYTVPGGTTAFILASDVVNNGAGAATLNLYTKLAAATSKHISGVGQGLALGLRTANLGAAQAVDAGGLIEGDASIAGVEYTITLLLKT